MQTRRANINSSLEISRESIDYAWTMPYAHFHNSFELYILTSGERIITIEEEEYQTFAGDVALFTPGRPHSSRGTTPFSGICVHFSKDFIQQSFGERARKALLRCFQRNIIHLSAQQLSTVNTAVDSFVPGSPFSFLQLGQILQQMTLALETHQKETSLSHHYRQESKASQIISYVNENYIHIHRVEELSAHFGVSESYIYRIFRETMNTSPKDYINHLRLENLLHRMRYSDKPIKTLAAQSGFSCYEYFTRLFKKIYGMSPGEYRKRLEKC